MTLTGLDWFIAVVVGLSGIMSLIQGFVKEITGIMSWILALTITWLFGGILSPFLEPYITNPEFLRSAASRLIIFITSLIIFSYIQSLLLKLVNTTGMGPTDKILGLLFGVVRGALLIIIFVAFLKDTNVAKEDFWVNSKFVELFITPATYLRNLLENLFFHIKSLM